MNEAKETPSFNMENERDRIVKTILETKKIEFDGENEISILGIDELMRQAPEGTTFQVPDIQRKKQLERIAESKNKNLKFEVEE